MTGGCGLGASLGASSPGARGGFAQPGKPIVAWAGAALVSTLLERRLVDELRLVVRSRCRELDVPFRTNGYRYWIHG